MNKNISSYIKVRLEATKLQNKTGHYNFRKDSKVQGSSNLHKEASNTQNLDVYFNLYTFMSFLYYLKLQYFNF